MSKVLRWTIYIGLAIQGLWGLLEVQSYIREPVVAEKKTRQFLQAFSLSLEDFSGPEFKKAPPNGFNWYVWTRQDGSQLVTVSAEDFGDIICLGYSSSESDTHREICLSSKHDILDECLYRGKFLLGCEPIPLRIPGLMKAR